MWPPPFVEAVIYEKKLPYFHIVDVYIRIYLYDIYLQYCIFLNILFMCNTLFTYTSKKFSVIFCFIIFSVFLGPDERVQYFECPVAMWSVISEDHLSSQHQGAYLPLTTDKSRD